MVEHITTTYEDFKDLHANKEFVIGYDEENKVVMISRENGARIYYEITDFPYYFCVRTKDVKSNRSVFLTLKERRKIQRIVSEGDFARVYVKTSNRQYRDDDKSIVLSTLKANHIDTYEADLTSYQRLVVDLKIKVASTYRTLYFDIETDDRGKGIIVGARRIVSIAAVDDEGHTYYWSDQDEKEILRAFFRKIEHYDLITGWNSEKFDIPYIKERAKKYQKDLGWYQWRQTVQVDMMQKLMEIHKRNIELIKEVRSFSLKAVSTHFLQGETKIEHTESIWELFTKNPQKLKEYNIQDCVLLRKLEEKLKIIGQKIAEHLVSGCFLNEFSVSRILDVYILKNAVGSGVRFKSKPPREENDFDPNKKAGYVGGLVLDPVQGIHYNVVHFDFTSLYPSIIQTFNISPETWICSVEENTKYDDIITPNGQVFSRKTGIIPKIIGGLLKARNDIRYNELKKYKEGSKEYEVAYFKQYAFKTISNSFYGILGASFTRYYRKETAEAITLSGHYMLNLVRQWCEAKDIQVLYGDTDSVFVKARFPIDATHIHEQINSFIAFHLFKHFGIHNSQMDLKVEAVYDSFLLLGKKKYVKNEEGKLKIVGLEARRRETLPFSAQKQTELLDLLMLKKATVNDIKLWVENLKEYVLSGKMTKEEVMLQIKLSKHVDEYQKKKKNKKTKEVELDDDGNEILLPSVLAHIKVANWLKENGIKENNLNTWEKGCYIKYIIINQSPKLEAKSIYQLEEGEYDRNYYWDVKVFAMMQRVLEVAFPEFDWSSYLVNVKRTKGKKKERVKKQREVNLKERKTTRAEFNQLLADDLKTRDTSKLWKDLYSDFH